MKNYLLGGVLAIWMSIPLVVSASPSGWVLGSPISQSDWISNAAGSNDNEKCTTVLNRTSCDYTGPSKALRVNYEYEFADEFWAGSQDRRLKNGCGRVQEAGNYNLGDNPNFGWTSAVTSNPWVYKNTSKVIIKANKYYQINAKPENRSSSNLLVKYVVEYANDAAATTRYQHTECYPYEISWCGDGVVDTDWFKKDPSDPAEQCDPESPSWKNRSDGKTCNSECKIVEPADPECSSTYNGKTQYTTSSSQWLTSSTPGLCKEGTLTGFSYSGTPRSYTWNCVVGSKVTSPSCSAKQQWCGDGEKNGDEDCDDGSKNGTSASTCSSSCTTVGSASCGTANGGTTYFSTKQTTPWLTKTSSGLCPSGLTASTPTIEGTDSHLEWKCSNANGGEKTCKAYQEYCGDGVKNGGEECDGTAGCDSQCNKITPAEGCKYTFTNKLRYGDEIQFSDTFDAGWHDRYLYYGPDDVIFKENHGDYNNGSNPVFQWTSSLTNGGMKVPANTSMVVMESKLPKYHIVKYPSQRAWDNIYVEYTIWYENSNLTPKPSKSNLYSHKECAYYEITRCGDGVIDENYGEECDPGSAGTSTLPDGRICNSNCKIEDAPSKKGKVEVEKTLISDTKYVTKVGQELEWQIKVTALEGDVDNVWIEDDLPEVLSYVSYTSDLPSGVTMNSGQPTKSNNGLHLEWQTSGTLKEGKSIILKVKTKVDIMPKTSDDYENVACAKADDVEEDCSKRIIPTHGTLTVEKKLISENKYVTKVGQELEWQIKVTAVDGDVDNVVIKDILPEILSYVSYTSDLPSGVTMNSGQPTKSDNGKTIKWKTSGTLKEGKSIILKVKTKVDIMPKKGDDYENVACAEADDVDEDCKPVPIGKGTLVPEKTLVGSKEVKKVGDLVLWKLKVTAVGGDVEDPIITDKLPPVLGYSGYMVSNYPSGVTIPDPTFGTEDSLETIEWKTTGTLKENDYIEIQLTTYAKVMPDKEYNNVLCVKTKDTPEDCVPVPIPAPKLRIKKTFSDGTKEKTVKVGDEIEYKVSFGNKGDASATITSIKDFLPKNVKYISSEIYINGESVHTNNPSGGEVINSSKKVDGVYIDIYGGITLEPGAEGYILIKGKVLKDNKDNRTNFACIYLNDKKPDDSIIDGDRCDDAVHNFEDGLLCKAPEITKKSFTNAGGSTTIVCKTSDGKAGNIELSCGDGATLSGSKESVLTGSNISSLTGTCVYPSNSSSNSKSYTVQCKVNGETGDSCKDTVTVSGTTPPGTCFTAGTKVTLADGTKKNIEDVKIGEKILGQDGSINTVLGYDRPSLGNRHLWSINGSEYFVSDEHPFMTTEGWKSFNPEMTKLEIDLNTTELKVGDIMITENGNVKVDTVDSIDADDNTQLYNFVLDGNHTYHANGYLVHNKGGGGPSCDKITTNPETLASGKDIEVTCKTSGGSAYVLIDCNYKTTNKYDGTNKGKTYFVSEGLVTTFTGTCKNYQLDTKIQCLVKESSSTSWESVTAKSDCGKVKNSSSSCFVAGTQVTMADGTKKNIEDVKIGEKILGQNGLINTVLGYDRPLLGNRHLWSINGSEYFVSDEHPFMTTEGWKSFNPEMTKLEIDLNTTELKVGDIMITENGNVKVDTVDFIDADDNTQLYNFVLDGNHTYHANGYLVHNKGGGSTTCFTAGTKVTMADGSRKNIEDVKIGEKIMGKNGLNTVLGYDRPSLGNRHLWSINGGRYFVSDEHPFMTTEGWKSFNPEMTKLEIDLNTTELKVGDIMITENGNVKVDTVDSIDAEYSTQLYNFILDGDHTYYADGYLVHNKGGGTTPDPIIAPMAECFDINANQLSYEQGEILPFYWNLDNLSKDDIWYLSGSFSKKVKDGDKCEKDAEGLVALNSMECSYDIVDSDGNVKKTGNFPCLTEENFTVNPFYQSRLDIGKNKMCGTSNNKCYFDFTTKATKARLWSKLNAIENFGAGWTRFGEYKIRMKKISYLRCNDGEWDSKEKSGESLCESTFTLTNPYTVQKTPSGNFRASTEALSNYRYCEKYEKVEDTNVKPKCLSWNNADKLLNAIAVSEYQPNKAVDDAMQKFINKYSKLAVSTGKNGLKKVPGKNIYFISQNICLGSKCTNDIKLNKPTTLVQTSGDVEIKGDVNTDNLMLLTNGKIKFTDPDSCTHRQVVKGIFYAKSGIERTPVQKNTSDRATKRCTEGGLTVKGVLIGNGLQQVMKNSRSNLNNWFDTVNGGKNAKTVMNGASVLIEYSPSVFTKSTMPPGAEDFTTALSIYKD